VAVRKRTVTALLIIPYLALASAVYGQRSYQQSQALGARSQSTRNTPWENNPTKARPAFRGWKQTANANGEFTRNCGPGCQPGVPTGAVGTDRELLPNNVPAFSGFGLRPTLPAGSIPTAAAMGDFNGDGHLDWVIANGGDNSLWLYLGNGDGTSGMPTVVPLTGLAPIWVVAVSLRNNGILDLVVAEADSSTVGVLLGNGDGTFQPEVEYGVPSPAVFVVAADFNGDGKVDVAVGMVDTETSNAAAAFAMLPGDGQGHLGAPVMPPQGGQGMWLATADLNGDGKPDLVVVDSDPNDPPPYPGAVVYLNNGNGTFTRGQLFDRGNPTYVPFSAALADLNGDGCVDAAVPDTEAVVKIYLGNCDGTFQQALAGYETGDFGYAIQIADLDRDGHLDIVTSGIQFDIEDGVGIGEVAGNLVSVMFGDGTGHFVPGRVYRGEPSMYGMAVGDVNGDGFPDVVTANQVSNTASVFVNDGHGGFGDPQGEMIGYPIPGVLNAPTSPLLFADLDGDGTQDVMLLEYPIQGVNPMEITTLLNDGTGKFSPPIRTAGWEAENRPWSDFILADFRNTGHPDLVVIGQVTDPFIVFVPNVGSGKFGTSVLTTMIGAAGLMAVGDFNGDGKLDFAAVSTIGNNEDSMDQINIFLGNGDGTFRAGQSATFGMVNDIYNAPISVFAGDFNRDGKLDVLVLTDGLYEFLGNGDGTFQAARRLFSSFGDATVADVNRDGAPDLIALTDKFGNPSGTVPIISVFLGQPDGSFAWSQTYIPYLDTLWGPNIFGSNYQRILFPTLLGDFNGDGNPDLAVFQMPPQGIDRSIFQILFGNGDGTFTPDYVTYSLSKHFVPQFAADVNGDGLSDLVELDGFTSSLNVVKSTTGGAGLQLQMLTAPVSNNAGWGRVILSSPASSATTVSFTASDPNVSAPSITIPAGSVSQDFPFTIGGGFNKKTVFTIQAQAGAGTATAYDCVSNIVTPVIELEPTALFFRGVNAGFTTAPQSITLKNLGSAALSPLPFTSPAFSQTNDCGNAVQPGGSCTFEVSFLAGTGLTDGQFALYDSVYPVYENVALNGFGLGLGVDPCCLLFNANLGTPPPPQTVTLTNQGTIALQVSSQLYPPGQGFTEKDDCEGTLAAGKSCQYTVSFMPQESGTSIDSILITDNAPFFNSYAISIIGNTSDFAVNGQGNLSETVNAGQKATFDLSVVSLSGFSGNVALSCSGSIPDGTCGVSPASVSVTSGQSQNFTVTVTTGARSSSSIVPVSPDRWRGKIYWSMALTSLIGCAFWAPRRKRTAISTFLLLLLICSCGGGTTSSGGSSTGGGGTGGGGSGTPAETYEFTVTGTSGSASHSATISVTVN
jgi:hypothetical protein